MAPENIAPLVVWLGSAESSGITGCVFELSGGHIGIAEGWTRGPYVDQKTRWDPTQLGPVVRELLKQAKKPEPIFRPRTSG